MPPCPPPWRLRCRCTSSPGCSSPSPYCRTGWQTPERSSRSATWPTRCSSPTTRTPPGWGSPARTCSSWPHGEPRASSSPSANSAGCRSDANRAATHLNRRNHGHRSPDPCRTMLHAQNSPGNTGSPGNGIPLRRLRHLAGPRPAPPVPLPRMRSSRPGSLSPLYARSGPPGAVASPRLPVALVSGALEVFLLVAYTSYLPALVGPEQLMDGNGKLSTTQSMAQAAGPGLGALLVGLTGAAVALGSDALSFAASAACLLAIRRREPRHTAAARQARPGFRAEAGAGLSYVLREPILRRAVAWNGTANFFVIMVETLDPVFLIRAVHLRPAYVGVLLALGAAGGEAAGPLTRRIGSAPDQLAVDDGVLAAGPAHPAGRAGLAGAAVQIG